MKRNRKAGPVAAEAGPNARPVGQSLLRDARPDRTPGRVGRAPFRRPCLLRFNRRPGGRAAALEAGWRGVAA